MPFQSSYKLRSMPHLATGLNDRHNSSEILDTDLADCENVEVDAKTIKNAAGYVDYGGDTGPFWGGFHAKFEDGTNELIRQRGTTLEYDDGSGSWTECTLPTAGSPAATVVLTEEPCSMVMLNDTVLWSNGFDVVMSSTDGITWALQAALPESKILFNNGLNRILFLAQTAIPSKISWSDINQPTTVGTSAYQFIGKNDGSEIMDIQLTPTGGVLLFKTDRFYQISDTTFDMISVDPIGYAPCVRHTVVATENSVIWAGPAGEIYEFTGGIAKKISQNIKPLGITRPEVMRAIYHNQKYRLAVPQGSETYNSYEYIVDRSYGTGVPEQPYAITKNQRYIGCYIKEDREYSGSRRTRVYFGDGRSAAIGSPAAVPTTFAYINMEHDAGVTQGLDGVAQTCTFTTKYFTEDVPFFVKRYTKFFCSVKLLADTEITLAYRTDQGISFTEANMSVTAGDLDWKFDDGSEGGWDDGFSWSYEVTDHVFTDIEKDNTILEGIQFKLTWTTTADIEILQQAYKFLTKPNFR